MQYRHATEDCDYSDYASGRVFHSLPGHPAFPVRLASEVFQRCLAARRARRLSGPCTLYDPCCGSGYNLSTLAYLHGEDIGEIIGSDVDDRALSVARRNFSLLTINGLDERIGKIAEMLGSYGKESHHAALKSAQALRRRLLRKLKAHPIRTRLFQADAADGRTLRERLQGVTIDMVFTDVPYGQHSQWRGTPAAKGAASGQIGELLGALREVLSPSSIVAVVSDKQPRIAHPQFQRIERFHIGKRQIVILMPLGLTS